MFEKPVMVNSPVNSPMMKERKIIGVLLNTTKERMVELATEIYRDLIIRELWYGSYRSGQMGRCFCETFGQVTTKEDGTQEFEYMSENGLIYSPDIRPGYRSSYPNEFEKTIDFNGLTFTIQDYVVPPRYLVEENYYNLIIVGARCIAHGKYDTERYPINKL